MEPDVPKKFFALSAFAIAFAFVESSVVVYLRALYYPEGFFFPLKVLPSEHLSVELAREAATVVMLASVGILAGEKAWNKFAYFIIVFGVWDIFYYVWLKVLLDWPQSLTEWDVLFLIPLPWIAPVIAPVLISIFLIIAGILIVRNADFQPKAGAWVLAVAGSGSILYSFMHDTDATLRGAMPLPYEYGWLIAGLVFYCAALLLLLRLHKRQEIS